MRTQREQIVQVATANSVARSGPRSYGSALSGAVMGRFLVTQMGGSPAGLSTSALSRLWLRRRGVKLEIRTGSHSLRDKQRGTSGAVAAIDWRAQEHAGHPLRSILRTSVCQGIKSSARLARGYHSNDLIQEVKHLAAKLVKVVGCFLYLRRGDVNRLSPRFLRRLEQAPQCN